MTYTDHDGKVHESARAFDPAKDKIEIPTGKAVELIDNLKSQFQTNQYSVFDMNLRKFTTTWCKASALGDIPQFSHRSDTFYARGELINEAQVYRFKNEHVKWLIENNKNQHGYRYMPVDNIWVECLLEKDGVTINGIHILKVRAKKNSEDHTFFMSMHENAPIPEDTEDAISIFYTGFDTAGMTFYQLSLLDRKDMWKRAKKHHYACPFCNSPLVNVSKDELTCENGSCIKEHGKIICDLTNPTIKKILEVMDMSDVWKVEDYVKTFVCNFLDFMTVKEVEVRVLMERKERQERNEKRAKRGQEPLPDMRIIQVTGHLYRYINLLQERIGAGNKLEHQQAVSGHFFRFWSRDRWHKLYDAINKCKGAVEIEAQLAKMKRTDEDTGVVLPDSQQYLWDKTYEVIMVWKLPFIRNPEGKKPEQDAIKVVTK